jgi:hypothetical protein
MMIFPFPFCKTLRQFVLFMRFSLHPGRRGIYARKTLRCENIESKHRESGTSVSVHCKTE